jgi:hypothetical protein
MPVRFLVVSVVLAANLAWLPAAFPAGGEFEVNANTTASPAYRPAVAADGAGNFVVVWSSFGSAGSDASSRSIHGRRYDSAGAAQGGEFQVNTYTTSLQRLPAVAADSAGNLVVVWDSNGSAGSDTSSTSIQGQRYDSTGAAQGGAFQVNTYTTAYQFYPAVAANGAGNFVVVWDGLGSAGSDTGYNIHGQRYTGFDFPLTDQLPGRITTIRTGSLATFVARPVRGDRFALPAADPVVEGGALRIFDTAATAGDDTYSLPAGSMPPFGWKGFGSPPGSAGYRYKGAGTPSDPCKVVRVRERVMKAVCKGSGVTLAPPFTGDVGIILSLGTTDRYCARFGGDERKNDATLTRRKNAPAPGACQ